MLNLRQSLIDKEAEVLELKRKYSEDAAELSKTKRELVTAQSDCRSFILCNTIQV